ncbi:MAG: hypothetical protein ACE10B_08485, partial [Phycisphaerales bacterium]
MFIKLITAIRLTRLTMAFGAVSDVWFVILLSEAQASNDSSHLIQEMRQGLLLQRVKYGASAMSI